MIRYIISEDQPKLNIDGLNKQFDSLCILESNTQGTDTLIALGSKRELKLSRTQNALQQLQDFMDEKKSWVFGILSYDLKNEIEDLHSDNEDELLFPLLHFFEPLLLIRMSSGHCEFHFDEADLSEAEAELIFNLLFKRSEIAVNTIPPEIKAKITKEEYIHRFQKLQQHIYRGDIYELNFCMEFFARNCMIDPVSVYEKLNRISMAPFAAFYRTNEHHLISSSPERFLKKSGNKLISQPMKGTIRRSEHEQEDQQLKNKLQNDQKERTENVMIVDLVRNDLSRIAKKGSVKVDELFGVYSFQQVHQMISTVSCELKENTSFTEIIKATFPMGSMTGAPKLSAMKLIEEAETTKRGIYSGALGYVDPEGNFDFSVVIRSILYNNTEKYLSFMTGSAITAKADPEKEYEECLLKAKAMMLAVIGQ